VMASGPKGSRPDLPGSRRKRPAPVIEGTATEIASEPVTPDRERQQPGAAEPVMPQAAPFEPTTAPATETPPPPETVNAPDTSAEAADREATTPPADEAARGLEFEQPAPDAESLQTPPIHPPPPPPPPHP